MRTESLTAADVQIKTASVEIKVMRVNNKQMTLAVFRQLPRLPLVYAILENGEIIRQSEAILWGVVNYHPDNSCYLPGIAWAEGHHWHFVYQIGDKLYRDKLYKNEYLKYVGKSREGMLEGSARNALLNNWNTLIWEITELDQLFIAV